MRLFLLETDCLKYFTKFMCDNRCHIKTTVAKLNTNGVIEKLMQCSHYEFENTE